MQTINTIKRLLITATTERAAQSFGNCIKKGTKTMTVKDIINLFIEPNLQIIELYYISPFGDLNEILYEGFADELPAIYENYNILTIDTVDSTHPIITINIY